MKCFSIIILSIIALTLSSSIFACIKIKDVSEFATELCGAYILDGAETQIEKKLQLNAETGKIFKKYGIDLNGQAEINSIINNTTGVVRKELHNEQASIRACKLEMARSLIKKSC